MATTDSRIEMASGHTDVSLHVLHCKGAQQVFSRTVIPVDVQKKVYRISAQFRAMGTVDSIVYLGVSPLTLMKPGPSGSDRKSVV